LTKHAYYLWLQVQSLMEFSVSICTVSDQICILQAANKIEILAEVSFGSINLT